MKLEKITKHLRRRKNFHFWAKQKHFSLNSHKGVRATITKLTTAKHTLVKQQNTKFNLLKSQNK